MVDKLPKPEHCPCCGGALEHASRTVEFLGRGGFRGRGPGRAFKKMSRPVHVCRRCNVAVVVHRMPAELSKNCGETVAGGGRSPVGNARR